MTVLDQSVSLKSSVREKQRQALDEMAAILAQDILR
jgi:hypothetical protein